jgi:hypothetical protein
MPLSGHPRVESREREEGRVVSEHCSKNVVVLGSEPGNSNKDRSRPQRGNCLRNIVESGIFRTDQKSVQVYESAALTAELRAHRVLTL